MRTRRLWVGILFGISLAPACGRSSRNGGQAFPGDAGAVTGGSLQSGGSSAAGTHSVAGTSNGGVSVAGATEMAGEPADPAGAAGAPGEGGDAGAANGGAGGEPPPGPVCDDGNPCTLDSFEAAGCQHTPAPDGQLCEDGSFCTLGDRCVAGACVPGAQQNGPGGALGNLETYGAQVAISVGDKRFAFVDAPALPARLTFAEVDDAGVLQTRDHIDLAEAVGYSYIGAGWDDVIVVADGDTSFGLGGPSRNLQLFSIEANGSITPHTIVPITPGAQNIPANSSMVGRGSRLFICHNWSFFSAPAGTLMWWDVSDLDAPVLVAQGSTNGQCGSIAASEDGERVYVNTINGVIWTDLSTWISGNLTFAADPLTPVEGGLSLLGDRLIARSGEEIRVFDESDHSLLASFTVKGANGAALMDAGIFVEADGSTASGTENSAALYDLSGNTLHALSVSKLAYARDIASQRIVASDGYAIDGLTHQMYAVSANGFAVVEQPQVGGLGWAFPGTDALHTRGYLAAHRIDVSDPVTPTILAGGPTREPLLGIKLDVSLTPASLISETDPGPRWYSGPDPAMVGVDPLLGHATQTLVQTVGADDNEHFYDGDSFALPGGSATLLSAGDFVYRAAYAAASGVHFQRWQVSDLRAGITAPALDLDFEAPAGAMGTPAVRFDVDANSRSAVVTALWASAGVTAGRLYWLDLATDPPSVVETANGNAANVRIRGDHLVYAENTPGGSKLHFRTRGSDADPNLEVADRIVRLLAFDGTTAYYAMDNALQAVTNGPAGPVTTLNLPMRGTPSSLVAAPSSLVATSGWQLLTLAPVCN